MNESGRRILKTTAAVVGISALGVLGSGTAFAATSTDLGGAPSSSGTSTADEAGLSSPASSRGGDLHTFAVPKMSSNVASPSTPYSSSDNRYNDNNDNNSYNDNNDNNSDSNYNDNNDNNSDYNDNGYDNGYSDYNDNGYGRYRNNDNGLLGGGLLGGN